jgi:glycine cleavage system H protein
MRFPEDLLYSESHEWVRGEGGQVTIGLTDYAQSQLKDVVYVELPEMGSEFKKGESIGVVESLKSAAVTGKVTGINSTLKDGPQFISKDPYGKGWIVRMEVQQKREELKGLLLSKTYQGSLQKEL